MVRLILDTTTLAQLESFSEPIELCAPDGRVVGQFVPIVIRSKMEPQVSEEELDRRQAARGGRPLAQILADFSGRR